VSEFKEQMGNFVSLQMEIAIYRQLQEYLHDFMGSDAKSASKLLQFDEGGVHYTVSQEKLVQVSTELAERIANLEKSVEEL